MFVIGTAGHVDHGKSTLIEAITGIDPDRLRQEKERGMTIELGFAWLTLPGGHEVSVVDVPGHERFIKNMLMGVGGIDMALLIVAADEGVMPQTREHLAILDILDIQRGLVAVTKSDLVDEEWLELVSLDIDELLSETSLADTRQVAVSATTGAGIPDLLEAIEEVLSDLPEKKDLGRPRLPVDRSFTISGFGTVVTGTLTDGRLRSGQEVEILPGGLRGRIRGLQTHKETEPEAMPGTRVAVNLSGVPHDQIHRGQVITSPRWLNPTDAIDVQLRVIGGAPRPIRHNAAIIFYTGSAECPARIRLLDTERLEPGETGWAQIKLEEPVAIVKGDYFVVRDTVTTLGGGVAITPGADRHRRFDESTVSGLKTLASGTDEDVLIGALQSVEPAAFPVLARSANQSEDAVAERITELVERGDVIRLGAGVGASHYSYAGWSLVANSTTDALREFHAQFPLRSGMPREELRSRHKMKAALFTLTIEKLEADGIIASDEALVRVPGHEPTFSADQQRIIDDYLTLLDSNGYSPPTDRPIESELLAALADQRKIIRAKEDVVFLRSTYDEMVSRVIDLGEQEQTITLADVRELFDTSRKYTLALLEQMDRELITRRTGDDRVLR